MKKDGRLMLQISKVPVLVSSQIKGRARKCRKYGLYMKILGNGSDHKVDVLGTKVQLNMNVCRNVVGIQIPMFYL
jgi:hypothetical protein